MSEAQWNAIDAYIGDHLIASDPILDHALRASDEAGLPQIAVAPNQGKMLQLLAMIMGARRILEIGTLGGYSTIWLARALPADGHLITLEYNPTHADVARANIAHAGLSDKVEVRVGRGVDLLPILADEGHQFDFVFVDADKPSNVDYMRWALQLTRRGGVIIVDNVIRHGGVIDANSTDAAVIGTRRLYEMLKDEKRVIVTAVQTVGSKGHDGLLMAMVTGD